MPPADEVLRGVTAIANDWRMLAIGWHVYFGILAVAIAAGWRPSDRVASYVLTAPLLSVSAAAWAAGNPFNGALFAALTVVLAAAARRLSVQPVTVTSSFVLGAGALLVAFGWVYPHFLDAEHWTPYAYAAPLGLLPCPTLSTVIGMTLVLGLFRSPLWTAALVAMGFAYGILGVFWLGVTLDYALLAGAAVLAAIAHERSAERARGTPDSNALSAAPAVQADEHQERKDAA